MGWYGDYATKQEIVNELRRDGSMVAHKMVGNVLWSIDINRSTGHKYIGCTLIEKSDGYYVYKPMCEEVGPYYYTCPLSYLDEVPEVNKEWREKVREYHREKKSVDSFWKSLTNGDRVELKNANVPYVIFDRFYGRGQFIGIYDGVRYRVAKKLVGA